jgi:hypothetical protein
MVVLGFDGYLRIRRDRFVLSGPALGGQSDTAPRDERAEIAMGWASLERQLITSREGAVRAEPARVATYRLLRPANRWITLGRFTHELTARFRAAVTRSNGLRSASKHRGAGLMGLVAQRLPRTIWTSVFQLIWFPSSIAALSLPQLWNETFP